MLFFPFTFSKFKKLAITEGMRVQKKKEETKRNRTPLENVRFEVG